MDSKQQSMGTKQRSKPSSCATPRASETAANATASCTSARARTPRGSTAAASAHASESEAPRTNRRLLGLAPEVEGGLDAQKHTKGEQGSASKRGTGRKRSASEAGMQLLEPAALVIATSSKKRKGASDTFLSPVPSRLSMVSPPSEACAGGGSGHARTGSNGGTQAMSTDLPALVPTSAKAKTGGAGRSNTSSGPVHAAATVDRANQGALAAWNDPGAGGRMGPPPVPLPTPSDTASTSVQVVQDTGTGPATVTPRKQSMSGRLRPVSFASPDNIPSPHEYSAREAVSAVDAQRPKASTGLAAGAAGGRGLLTQSMSVPTRPGFGLAHSLMRFDSQTGSTASGVTARASKPTQDAGLPSSSRAPSAGLADTADLSGDAASVDSAQGSGAGDRSRDEAADLAHSLISPRKYAVLKSLGLGTTPVKASMSLGVGGIGKAHRGPGGHADSTALPAAPPSFSSQSSTASASLRAPVNRTGNDVGDVSEYVIDSSGPWPVDLSLKHTIRVHSAVSFDWMKRGLGLPTGTRADRAPLRLATELASTPLSALLSMSTFPSGHLLSPSTVPSYTASSLTLDQAAVIALAQCCRYVAYPEVPFSDGQLSTTAAVVERLHVSVSRELQAWDREVQQAKTTHKREQKMALKALADKKAKLRMQKAAAKSADHQHRLKRIEKNGSAFPSSGARPGRAQPQALLDIRRKTGSDATSALGAGLDSEDGSDSDNQAGEGSDDDEDGAQLQQRGSVAWPLPSVGAAFIPKLPRLPQWLPGSAGTTAIAAALGSQPATGGGVLYFSAAGGRLSTAALTAQQMGTTTTAPQGAGASSRPRNEIRMMGFADEKHAKKKTGGSEFWKKFSSEEKEKLGLAKQLRREAKGGAVSSGSSVVSQPVSESSHDAASSAAGSKSAGVQAGSIARPAAVPVADEPLVLGVPSSAYLRIKPILDKLTKDETDGAPVWVHRVRRCQEALASAYSLILHGLPGPMSPVSSSAAGARTPAPLPVFMVRFGNDERAGNVILIGRSSFMLQLDSPGSIPVPTADNADMPVAIVARSTMGLRLRLANAGLQWTSPLDPELQQLDMGDVDYSTLQNMLRLERAAFGGVGGVDGQASAPIKISAAAIGMLKVQMGIARSRGALKDADRAPVAVSGRDLHRKREKSYVQEKEELAELENDDDDQENDDEDGDKNVPAKEAAEDEEAGSSGKGIGSSAAQPTVSLPPASTGRAKVVSKVRGTPESKGSLLLVTGGSQVSLLVALLLESMTPGGQTSFTSTLAHMGIGLSGSASTGASIDGAASGGHGGGGGGPGTGVKRSEFVPARIRVPLTSFALPGAGSGSVRSTRRAGQLQDVPQVLCPLGQGVIIRHGCVSELDVTVSTASERKADGSVAARYELQVRGPVLYGVLPKLSAILSLMQVREWRRASALGSASTSALSTTMPLPLLSIASETQRATTTFSSLDMLSEVLQAVITETMSAARARKGSSGGRGAGTGGHNTTDEEEDAEKMLESSMSDNVDWLALNKLDARVDSKGLISPADADAARPALTGLSGGGGSRGPPASIPRLTPPATDEEDALRILLAFLPQYHSVEEAVAAAAKVYASRAGPVFGLQTQAKHGEDALQRFLVLSGMARVTIAADLPE